MKEDYQTLNIPQAENRVIKVLAVNISYPSSKRKNDSERGGATPEDRALSHRGLFSVLET